MVDMSVRCPVNEQSLIVRWFRKELLQFVKLLGIGTDNRMSGMNHCSSVTACANLMKVTL